jgi:lipopolysaccharide export system permease protein
MRTGATLFSYMTRQFLRWMLGFFVLGTAIIFIADFVELVRRTVDKESFSALTAVATSALKTPSLAEEFLPFAVLFGAIGAFMALNRNLELVVMRAAGVSVWQFVAPPVDVALVVGIAASTLYNPLSAFTRERANALAAALLDDEQRLTAETKTIWFRQEGTDGHSIMHADSGADGGRTLYGVAAYLFGPDGRFTARVHAPTATLRGGRWRLAPATVFGTDGTRTQADAFEVPTFLSPAQVQESVIQASAVSFWELPAIVEVAENAGLPTYRYELQFQLLLARPLMLAAMVLVAATVSLQLVRMGGAARALTGGVIAGFVLYVAAKISGDLGRAGVVAPPLAAWLPGLAAALFGASRLLHKEDG